MCSLGLGNSSMNKKTFISFTFLFLWLLLIFYFSSQVADDSNELSHGIMNNIIKFIEGLFPNSTFDFSNLNFYIRKSAHFITYLVLGVLTINAFSNLGLLRYRLFSYSLLFCVLYAASDEFHQSFVPGRSGQGSDVLLDSVGALVGILIYLLFWIKLNKPYYKHNKA